MEDNWKIRSVRTEHRNPWWEYRIADYNTQSGRSGEYHFIHTNGGVIMVPLMDGGDIMMIRQYRYPSDDVFLEFPAGGVKLVRSFIESAHEELREETGYDASEMEEFGSFVPYVGVTDENCKIFVARKLFWSPLSKDLTEDMKTLQVPIGGMDEMLSKSSRDGKTLATWALVRGHL